MCASTNTSTDSEKILLSIIIPVYNVEAYLDRCLSSILMCNLDMCEILLSLGQSADNSNSICMEYEKKYSFIRTLKQGGVGLSDARNCALKAAKGTYILFIDSDDFVSSNNLDYVLDFLRSPSFSADIMITDFYHLDRRSGKIVGVFQIGEHGTAEYGMDFLPVMLQKRQCFWNVWRYIYRRGFLMEHNIWFLENRLSEDIDYTTSVFLAEPNVVFLHTSYYVYGTGRGDSLMDCPNLKRLTDTVFILQSAIQRLRTSDFLYAPLMIARLQFEYLLNMALTVEIEPMDRNSAIELYKNWKTVLSNSADPAVSLGAFAIKVLGVRTVSQCLHYLKHIRRWSRRHLEKKEALNVCCV